MKIKLNNVKKEMFVFICGFIKLEKEVFQKKISYQNFTLHEFLNFHMYIRLKKNILNYLQMKNSINKRVSF